MLTEAKARLWNYLHPSDHPRATYIGNGRLLVKSNHGPMLVSSLDLSVMPFLALYGTFEDELAHWLTANLREGQTFVDVGANIGWFTVIAARAVGASGRVIAVEADPRNYELLLDNTTISYLAERVTALNVAAWHEAGELTFHQSAKFRGNSSVAGPDDAYRRRYPGDAPERIRVEAVRLDDVLAGVQVNVLKMDIEGAEADALAGLEATLEDGRLGAIIIEVNPPAAGESWPRLVTWFRRREAAGWSVTDLTSGQPLTFDALVSGRNFPNVVLHSRQPAT